MRIKNMVMAAVAALALAACGGGKKDGNTTPTGDGSAVETKSLYDRLGGKDAIIAVVDDMVANIAADARINAFFANTDIPKLKGHLVDQICEASGGPCKYTGKTMKEAHTGMKVKGEHFDALVEDLVKALDKFKVGEKEKADLLGALGPMKADIVE
ncbi:MAG: group I truncated hemoglobin [Kofleriaceae bacterium]